MAAAAMFTSRPRLGRRRMTCGSRRMSTAARPVLLGKDWTGPGPAADGAEPERRSVPVRRGEGRGGEGVAAGEGAQGEPEGHVSAAVRLPGRYAVPRRLHPSLTRGGALDRVEPRAGLPGPGSSRRSPRTATRMLRAARTADSDGAIGQSQQAPRSCEASSAAAQQRPGDASDQAETEPPP